MIDVIIKYNLWDYLVQRDDGDLYCLMLRDNIYTEDYIVMECSKKLNINELVLEGLEDNRFISKCMKKGQE